VRAGGCRCGIRHLYPRFTTLGYPERARALELAADRERASGGMLRHMRLEAGSSGAVATAT
jgi:hypothetical protein